MLQLVFADEPQSELVVCHWTCRCSRHGGGQRVARKGNRDKAAFGRIPGIGGRHRDLDGGRAHGDIDRHGIVSKINLVPSTSCPAEWQTCDVLLGLIGCA
jgi:hypothetical protein